MSTAVRSRAEQPLAEGGMAASAKGRRVGKRDRAAGEWLRASVIAAALLVFLRLFVVQVYGVTTGSMEGTLRPGDYVLASNTLFGAPIPFTGLRLPALRSPRHGDVVVFRPAGYDPPANLIKRVIGEPGDTILMAGRVVYRNGRRLGEPYVDPAYTPDEPMLESGPYNFAWHRAVLPAGASPDTYRPTRDDWGPLVVPPGHYLLLGDNRDESIDSRYTGFVPRSEIRGKVLAIHYSAAGWGRIGIVR